MPPSGWSVCGCSLILSAACCSTHTPTNAQASPAVSLAMPSVLRQLPAVPQSHSFCALSLTLFSFFSLFPHSLPHLHRSAPCCLTTSGVLKQLPAVQSHSFCALQSLTLCCPSSHSFQTLFHTRRRKPRCSTTSSVQRLPQLC